MGGQPDDKTTKAAFEALMSVFDRVFEYDAPFPESFPDGAIDQYEKLGALDWLSFYEDEDNLAVQFMSEFGPALGVVAIKGDPSPEEAILLKQQMDSIELSGRPAHPRKLKELGLSHGVRWLITTRVLKTIVTCRIRFEISVSELIQQAKGGDEKALLKLAKLDSTFLTTDYAKRILRAIELKQDTEFKKKLSKSLIPEKDFWTMKHPRKNLRDAIALSVLSMLGYEDRPYPDWADFMEKQGFENLISEQNIASFVKNYSIPKKHPKRNKNLEK